MIAFQDHPSRESPQKGTPPARARRSGVLEVDRGGLALLATLDIVADLLTFGQRHLSALDGRDVHEHILGTVVGLDETIPLLRVEPLHGAYGHRVSPMNAGGPRRAGRITFC